MQLREVKWLPAACFPQVQMGQGFKELAEQKSHLTPTSKENYVEKSSGGSGGVLGTLLSYTSLYF